MFAKTKDLRSIRTCLRSVNSGEVKQTPAEDAGRLRDGDACSSGTAILPLSADVDRSSVPAERAPGT